MIESYKERENKKENGTLLDILTGFLIALTFFVFYFLAQNVKEVSTEMICIYILRFSLGDRIVLFLEPSLQNISLEEVTLFCPSVGLSY